MRNAPEQYKHGPKHLTEPKRGTKNTTRNLIALYLFAFFVFLCRDNFRLSCVEA